MKDIIISTLICTFALYNSKVTAANLPGPMVYVVTPSTPSPQNEEARSAPFYYHNWMRRMDLGPNTTTSVPMTTTMKKKETPDLIFAEFESDSNGGMKKSIRKLLEKERVEVKTSTTFQPIYVDEESKSVTQKTNYGIPLPSVKPSDLEKKPDYFEMYNQLYNNVPGPIYIPTTTPLTTTKLTTTTSTESLLSNVENIWHIIDSEKSSHSSDNWEEVPVEENHEEVINSGSKSYSEHKFAAASDNGDEKLYNNFEVSGFATNPGNGAENESRAIRTESNNGFPYINLKPFQVKTMQKPVQNYLVNSKKNNLFTNLDNFYDVKKPVRGEAQDITVNQQPIDRYNPAQPYLPQSYGGNSKQTNSAPVKTSSNLVPPPPPPLPKLTDNDFPAPTNYDSFPPYPPSVSDTALPSLPISKPSISVYSPPGPPSPPNFPSPPSSQLDNSGPGLSYGNENNDTPLMELGYRYQPPSSSIQSFEPTLPPVNKPFKGYGYSKPPKASEFPDGPSEDNSAFQGYHYDKPGSLSPSSNDIPSLSYNHHDSFNHDTDYKDLIFQKDHGDDSKESDPNNGVDMMPPPPPDMKPESVGPHLDDTGFPSDFPSDFKYHYDFDDHDFSHHHHHHTTTTTTEMPRVNRFSYYYLGKKLYYLPLYFSVYFIVYVGALIIKAVLRHKIVYPNSWRPNGTTAGFFTKRAIESWDLSNENLHEITGKVTHAIATAAKKYLNKKKKLN